MDLTALLHFIRHFFMSEAGRITATGIVVGAGFICSKLWMRYLLRGAGPGSIDKRRQQLVWAKNVIALTCLATVAFIWASNIAKLALSLAAVAGALLIVSKELLMCGLGYGLISLSKPYRIGDFIEIGTFSGRVIDIDVFSTTLAETGGAHQLTGRTLNFPNSMVLSQAVRNSSATGTYIVDLYKIVVPFDVDMPKAESAALAAANDATGSWQEKAEAHFKRIEDADFLDLPSSRPKVLWEASDSKQHFLVVRFACPTSQRVTAEQEIFRKFWSGYLGKDESNNRL